MPELPIEHSGLEVLPFEACIQRLATVPVGRIGFFADGELVVLPVNHAIDGQDPVFCTARGSKLSAAGGQSLVAFEVDEYDRQAQSGWSVLVTGRAEVVYEESEVQRLNRLGLHSWPSAVEHPFWIRIRPTSVTGRQTPKRHATEPRLPSGHDGCLARHRRLPDRHRLRRSHRPRLAALGRRSR